MSAATKPQASKTAERRRQCASAVLMIRPTAFSANPQTRDSNRFQKAMRFSADAAQQAAVREFESLASALRDVGIQVIVFDDTPKPHTPSSLFPNNWVSFHRDGRVVLYPMLAENRRLERRHDIIDQIGSDFGYDVRAVMDLSEHEAAGRYLEGTGSLVLDHINRKAYACLSPRTDARLVEAFCRQFDYTPVLFDAVDRDGTAIYHTNVVMAVGDGFAVLCDEAIRDEAQREKVLSELIESGLETVLLSLDELENFAGNMLEVENADGEYFLVLSQRAYDSLNPDKLAVLQKHARLLPVAVNVIEDLEGGSVRCMLAEIFLPQAETAVLQSDGDERFEGPSIQETYAPHNTCFGCGPANPKGLRIRSFPDGNELVARWQPAGQHQAFPGVLNGGVVGSLLDCHCNWTAAWHLMNQAGTDTPPCTVTANYSISLKRPTPTDGPVTLRAWVDEATNDRATIKGELSAGGKLCAECTGLFIAVRPGHPAYHRW